MKNHHHFQLGQTIILQEFWQDRLRRVVPQIVVRDTTELMAFWVPCGTILKMPSEGDRLRSKWTLLDAESTISLLRLVVPGADYSVMIFRNADGSHIIWYINLEEPLRRTEQGFDYTDQLLDIIAAPDLSSWRWDDEDELADAVNLGQLSPDRAAVLRSEGEKAIAWLLSGKSPFNSWDKWRPDPKWTVPVLPQGWDIVNR